MAKTTPSTSPNRSLYIVMIALVGLVFSYQPLLQLGNIAGVHIDISLSYIFVGAAILCGLPAVWKQRSKLYDSRVWLLLASLVVYLIISTAWSPNPVRGIFTSIFWLAILAMLSVVMLYTSSLRKNGDTFLRWTSIAYKLVIVWVLWQLLADALGISPLYSLLPVAYSGDVFGFARPTGFALEPQFLGSLLLIPFGWVSYRILKNRATTYEYISYGILVSVLLLTLSRGALFGALVTALTILVVTRPTIRTILQYGALGLIGLVCSLIIIFGIAQARTSDTISGKQAVSQAINHLTLGSAAVTPDSSMVQPNTAYASSSLALNGYIRSSTDSRVSQAQQAIAVWQTNPITLLFGVGAGGFGVASESKQPGNIVNNFYLELLAEGGLVAFSLFMATLVLLLLKLSHNKRWLLFALLFGLFSQALFYSGNANILHIWALVGFALGTLSLGKTVKAKQH